MKEFRKTTSRCGSDLHNQFEHHKAEPAEPNQKFGLFLSNIALSRNPLESDTKSKRK
jgi:hypothetical protein